MLKHCFVWVLSSWIRCVRSRSSFLSKLLQLSDTVNSGKPHRDFRLVARRMNLPFLIQHTSVQTTPRRVRLWIWRHGQLKDKQRDTIGSKSLRFRLLGFHTLWSTRIDFAGRCNGVRHHRFRDLVGDGQGTIFCSGQVRWRCQTPRVGNQHVN